MTIFASTLSNCCLQWGRRYQEEELLALRLEVGEVSGEVEAEIKQLRDREEIIRAIRDEQRQDRIKIQTLLALSQPITPDITVVFQALAPDACPPPLPPPSRGARPLDRSYVPQNNRRAVASNSPSRRSVAAAAATAGRNAGRGEQRPRRRRYLNDGIGSDGCSGGEQINMEGERNAGRGEEEATGGVSYGLYPGRRWTSERVGGNGGHADRRRGGREGGVPGSRRRRRPRSGDGGGSLGTRKSREANRLCTRGYQQHLERRLELNERHLRELERLEGSYHETLTRDKQEREIHARVQRDNAARVVEALERRNAEVEKRLSGATDDYLRLRHKAKEAHAVSAEEQRQCREAREKSQAEVRSLLAAAEAKVEATKVEGGRRLEDCTAGLREKLGEAEEALQGERSHHAAIKQRFEERVGRARDGVLATRRRHHKLVRRRAQEVVHLSDEMSALRRGVTELERRMFQAW
ncbi:unnamed protein product [Ectocarpus sp. CCAP 1310/34]|nr:unnamed protein product [Ectocarpus sp. CCAP 1310/34]